MRRDPAPSAPGLYHCSSGSCPWRSPWRSRAETWRSLRRRRLTRDGCRGSDVLRALTCENAFSTPRSASAVATTGGKEYAEGYDIVSHRVAPGASLDEATLARRFGASRWGIIGSIAGLLVGLPFGLPGIVFGPALGALALEFARDRELRKAARAGTGVLVGFVLGTIGKYAIASVMIGLLALAYLF